MVSSTLGNTLGLALSTTIHSTGRRRGKFQNPGIRQRCDAFGDTGPWRHWPLFPLLLLFELSLKRRRREAPISNTREFLCSTAPAAPAVPTARSSTQPSRRTWRASGHPGPRRSSTTAAASRRCSRDDGDGGVLLSLYEESTIVAILIHARSQCIF